MRRRRTDSDAPPHGYACSDNRAYGYVRSYASPDRHAGPNAYTHSYAAAYRYPNGHPNTYA